MKDGVFDYVLDPRPQIGMCSLGGQRLLDMGDTEQDSRSQRETTEGVMTVQSLRPDPGETNRSSTPLRS